jgi:hypothetical protein
MTEKHDSVTAHKELEAVVIGDNGAPVRFTVEKVFEEGIMTAVAFNAESAAPGKIAYLKTKLWASGSWQTMLAVSDPNRNNLPPVSVSLKDDFGNDYILLAINPQKPPFQELYPNARLELLAIFKGPVVEGAKAVRFQMSYFGDGHKVHEWSFPR